MKTDYIQLEDDVRMLEVRTEVHNAVGPTYFTVALVKPYHRARVLITRASKFIMHTPWLV